MKKIKVAFLYNEKEWTEYLSRFYEVEISEKPDFVICDSGSTLRCVHDFDCVRIVCHGENVRTDFNLFDYATGFDVMQFGDRYLYFPLFMGYEADLQLALHKHEQPDAYYLDRNGFCNFVVSNGNAATQLRDEMFECLSLYKKVDSGGRYKNNLPDGKPVENKLEFQKRYRFSLAFENSSYKGYTTEKIIQAFAAGTIPIYWGDPDVATEFNPKAFVNCMEYRSLDEVIKRIKEIDQDESLYLAMQKESIINPEGNIPKMLEESYRDTFFRHIFDQDPSKALRRTNAKDGWGAFLERDACKFYEMEHSKAIQMLYTIEKKLGRLK
ncbi:MAG: hypothetical protein K5682_05650 [Lachnospiraceae bacterium]|nr:hypothetical protein [Lachnospiraceae bacterium]